MSSSPIRPPLSNSFCAPNTPIPTASFAEDIASSPTESSPGDWWRGGFSISDAADSIEHTIRYDSGFSSERAPSQAGLSDTTELRDEAPIHSKPPGLFSKLRAKARRFFSFTKKSVKKGVEDTRRGHENRVDRGSFLRSGPAGRREGLVELSPSLPEASRSGVNSSFAPSLSVNSQGHRSYGGETSISAPAYTSSLNLAPAHSTEPALASNSIANANPNIIPAHANPNVIANPNMVPAHANPNVIANPNMIPAQTESHDDEDFDMDLF